MENSSLRLFLESLCHNSPWDYAVFWKLQNNPNMLLTWEDGYYDVHRLKSSDQSLCLAMAEMATTCYAIGEGVIGEAAYIGVPQWVLFDNIANYGFNNNLVSQFAQEWLPQFSVGIKTILLIPFLPDGVLQMGSFETIHEDPDLVTNIKNNFTNNQNFHNYPSSFYSSTEIQNLSNLTQNIDNSSFNNYQTKDDHTPLINIVDPLITPYNHEPFFSTSNHTDFGTEPYLNQNSGVYSYFPENIMNHSDQFSNNHYMEPFIWDSSENNVNRVSNYDSLTLPINTRERFVSESSNIEREDSGPRSCVTSAIGNDLLHRTNMTKLSTINKKRAKPGENQKPKPRDRQLIQDRVKELRELVPNVAKCSIDGLLDKTIKHMVYLQSITERADKLRKKVVKENLPEIKDNGTSWALDLGDEKQICPIIVKDLEVPGQMLIEMVCDDYGRFLEITDVILRLELTILKGVMEKQLDCTRAHFIVETRGSFHRLDLFWPLMKLLQQNTVPISSKI